MTRYGTTLVLLFSLIGPVWAEEDDRANNAVVVKKDISYHDGEDAHRTKHKLDLFLPRDAKDVPVLFFVHGGAWIQGDKNFLGMYSAIGRCFASRGIATVVINYRLSPAVQHPEHIKDVARAFAWTVNNIKEYGGNPEQIFVSGHSAGGHLIALLATDESYLKEHKIDPKAIRGAIPLSGIFDIDPRVAWFKPVFGEDEKCYVAASPIHHVRPGLPDFLIIYAENDLPVCDEKCCKAFCKALGDQNVKATTLEIKGRNHANLIINASRPTDPCAQAIRDFIDTRIKPSK